MNILIQINVLNYSVNYLMKKIIFILIIICPIHFLYSQAMIKGIVIDSDRIIPLSNVNIIITPEADKSKNIKLESGNNGSFVINNIDSGKYSMIFQLNGYDDFILKDVSVDEYVLIMFLDTVKMKSVYSEKEFIADIKESDSLKEGYILQNNINDTLNKNEFYETDVIDVVSELPVMTTEDEKKVFNIENLVSTAGGTALDVLRKIPMIDVDINDNVSLRGTKNVSILIDNKPMKFASLRQIPAESIRKVEIITNPSAKYEAEGVTGIINIVMKKANPDVTGYNGNIFGSFRSNNGFNGFAGLNAKVSKWTFFGNGGGGLFKFDSEFNTHTDYYYPVSYFRQESDGNGESKYGFISAGIENEINKYFNFGFDSYINLNKFDNTGFNENFNYDINSIITSTAIFNSSNTGNYDNYTASVYFNGIFDDTGKELNFDATYIYGKNIYNSRQDYQFYDSSGAAEPRLSNQLTAGNDKNYNLKIQADYTHPFNGKTRFETGYKGIFRENDNDYRFDTLNFNTNNYITNSELTNHFKLSENINAVYGTFSNKIRDFRIKLGLRVEHTLTKGELITGGTDFKKDYINLFPTLSLSQKIGLQNEFQFSYSRRITRPMIYRLNPFVNRSNSRFIYFGNPELNPEFTDSYELGYNFYAEFATINTALFFRRSYDVMSGYSYQVDSITTATTYRNAAGAKSYGVDIIVSSRFTDWWNIYANLSFYSTKYEGSVVSDYTAEEGSSWRGNIRSTFTVSNLFDIEVYYNYSGRRINANGFNQPVNYLDIAIRRSFFDKKLSVSVRAEDIFKTKKWEGESSGAGFRNYYTSEWESRLFNISISYRFGNTDKYYSKSKKTKENENEQEDVKEGN